MVRYILSAEEADLIKEANLNSGDVSEMKAFRGKIRGTNVQEN